VSVGAKAAVHDQLYAYWVAYYDTVQLLVDPYSEIIDQFPSFISSPVDIRVREARDGIVVIHTRSDRWTFGSQAMDADLRDIVSVVQVPTPAPADLDLWLGETSLTVSDAITGEVVGQKISDWHRLDVVGTKSDARWDPIHARVAAQRDFAQAQAQIAAEALGATKVVETLRTQIQAFVRELDANPPEEAMQRFLDGHPLLLAPSAARVVPKLKLGSEYVTDFVVVESESEYVLVELESPRQLLFTRNGRPRAPLTHAIQQVRDWRAWVRQHHEYAQAVLPGIAEPRCIVVIGRRPRMSDGDRTRLQHLNAEEFRIRVMTYDDLITQASQFADNLEAVAKSNGRLVTTRAPDARPDAES
jgi:hypothetical protein